MNALHCPLDDSKVHMYLVPELIPIHGLAYSLRGSIGYQIVPSEPAYGYLLCVFIIILEKWKRSVIQ